MDVIDLGAGDNDTPPPAVGRRGHDGGAAATRPTASTASSRGCRRSGRRRRAGWSGASACSFDPITETLPLIGSKEGLSHLPFAVVNPGDVAIVPEPGYQAYLGGAILAGAEPYIAPLRPENDFLLELEQVPEARAAARQAGVRQLSQQPDGRRRDRRSISSGRWRICRRHGILLAYDNAYCDLTFDGYRAPSIFEIRRARATWPSSSSRSPRASR